MHSRFDGTVKIYIQCCRNMRVGLVRICFAMRSSIIPINKSHPYCNIINNNKKNLNQPAILNRPATHIQSLTQCAHILCVRDKSHHQTPPTVYTIIMMMIENVEP